MTSKRRPKTPWHLFLGRLFSLFLEPLRIQVLVEFPLLTEAPKADIVLLRREDEQWTDEQRRWLADGLRHADQRHLLIEFKYGEPLDRKAVQQLSAYDYFYRQARRLGEGEVACFLVVARTPRSDWHRRLGFRPTEWPGVYRGSGPLLERMRVLLLNELAPTPHNAPLKCFASHEQERLDAFELLRDSGFVRLSRFVERFITGLWRLMTMGHAPQTEELTPDDVMAMGKKWLDALLDAMPMEDVWEHYGPDKLLSHVPADEVLKHFEPEQRLAGLTEEQRLAGLTEEQRLAGLTDEQRLAGLTNEQRLAGLTNEQRLAGLTEEQRLAGLTEEQRLSGLTEQQILAYLERLRRSQN